MAVTVVVRDRGDLEELTVSANTAPSPARAFYSNVLASVTGADNSVHRLLIDSYGTSDPLLMFLKAGGTAASPSASVPSVIGGMAWYGHTGQTFTTARGQVRGVFTETWTPTANGMRVYISTTQNGTVTESEKFSVEDDGEIKLPNGPYVTSARGALYAEADGSVAKGAVGTFTPTVSLTVPGDLSVGYTTQTGRYSVVGDLVYIEFRIVFTLTYTTGSGVFFISGLPFNLANTDIGAGHIMTANGLTYSSGPVLRVRNATSIALADMPSGGTQAFLTAAAVPSGATTYTISGSMWYKRAA